LNSGGKGYGGGGGGEKGGGRATYSQAAYIHLYPFKIGEGEREKTYRRREKRGGGQKEKGTEGRVYSSCNSSILGTVGKEKKSHDPLSAQQQNIGLGKGGGKKAGGKGGVRGKKKESAGLHMMSLIYHSLCKTFG